MQKTLMHNRGTHTNKMYYSRETAPPPVVVVVVVVVIFLSLFWPKRIPLSLPLFAGVVRLMQACTSYHIASWDFSWCPKYLLGLGSSSKNSHFQNEARCTTFLVKMSFICMRMKNDFHIKGWAPTLVLKQRPGGTRKWPIHRYVWFCIYSRTKPAKGHLSAKVAFFRRTKNPYIDSCLKPLYNGLFLLSPGRYFTFSKKIKINIFFSNKGCR